MKYTRVSTTMHKFGQRLGGLSIEQMVILLMWSVFALVAGLFFWILWDIFSNGLSQVSWTFITESPRSGGREGGIASVLVATAMIVGICMLVALPIGVGTAVWLVEFTPANSSFSRIVRMSLDVLAAMPSIVFGLFGNAFFSITLGLGFSILSGGLTLTCMVLPFLIRTCVEALYAVPSSYRLGAAALGLSRTSTLWNLLLPTAMSGIVTGFLLGMGRALAETAALLFTSGYVDRMPESIFDSGRTISIHIYDLSMNVPGGEPPAYGSAVVLIILLLVINFTILGITRYWQHRRLT
jgi:phosphate transport system permease protein